MSPAARVKAYDEIMAKCAVSFAVIDHEEIDRINIFQATMRAMQLAVARLPEVPDLAVVDGPSAPKFGCAARAIVDGDALSFSIACASVVAKVTRDRLMEAYDAQYPAYGFARHKGYGTEEHIEALRRHGPCGIHRQSFEPVRNWRKLAARAAEN
jgi:ribonuclease HII